jgi:hypothetical protein
MLVPKPLILWIQTKSVSKPHRREKVHDENLVVSLRDSNESAQDSQEMKEKSAYVLQ